jgi:hypothetical protein
MIIRDFLPSDLEAAYQLDQSCFEQGISFTRGQIRDFVRRPGRSRWWPSARGIRGDGRVRHRAGLGLARPRDHDRRRARARAARARPKRLRRAAGALRGGRRETVRLEVDLRNAPARRFYERMGFEETRKLPDYYGYGRDGMRMVEEL